MRLKIYSFILLYLMLVLFGGCVNTVAPVQDLSIAKMAVLDASDIKDDKEARHYFAKAKEELTQSQKMMQQKEYSKAKFLAQKATADARLAKIKSTNAALLKKVKELDLELKKVKKDFVTIDESGE